MSILRELSVYLSLCLAYSPESMRMTQAEDPRCFVEGFGKVGQVSRLHRSFVQTLEMVNQLRDMYDKIEYCEALLQRDRQDPLGPAPNLLAVHYSLTQLESFRNETVLQAKRSKRADMETLNRYFERLAGTIEVRVILTHSSKLQLC